MWKGEDKGETCGFGLKLYVSESLAETNLYLVLLQKRPGSSETPIAVVGHTCFQELGFYKLFIKRHQDFEKKMTDFKARSGKV